MIDGGSKFRVSSPVARNLRPPFFLTQNYMTEPSILGIIIEKAQQLRAAMPSKIYTKGGKKL